MTVSITERIVEVPDHREREMLRDALEAVRADNAELRTRLTSLLAKLDADAGVTDTNYAATLTPASAELLA